MDLVDPATREIVATFKKGSFFGENCLVRCTLSKVPLFWNNLNDFKDFHTENGSSQCQKLALTGLFVPPSLSSDSRLATKLGRCCISANASPLQESLMSLFGLRFFFENSQFSEELPKNYYL